MKKSTHIVKTGKLLLLSTLILLGLSCTKDESSSEEPEEMLDLAGTWEMDMLGSFTLDKQISAGQETFVESVTIDLEHAMCLGTNFKQTFDAFAFGNVKDNKIQNAMAGDQFTIQAGEVTKWPGFSRDDLRRMDFSCDFMSFPDANGTIILHFRRSFSSDWCEESLTFTASKRE